MGLGTVSKVVSGYVYMRTAVFRLTGPFGPLKTSPPGKVPAGQLARKKPAIIS